MNADNLESLCYLYLFVAVLVSIFAAQSLEKRLKSKVPATRPYRWGFYVGCMGVACVPFVVLMAVATLVSGMGGSYGVAVKFAAYMTLFTVHTISGWFVIRRKRWAWVLSTISSFNIVIWFINYVYGSNRWGEFAGEPYGPAGTEDEGYELLSDATNLERQGRVQEALAAYQRIIDTYSHTAAGEDARKSLESLQATVGK